ncbi:hypothetical protein KSP39_PZI001084 [Platanthera zijinensis]|uniref:Uncharacterized protein n=1 Tax=Platanthera zijinensis TaxID=2320716 RepID=A0AAP0C1Q4_9ASPA
MQSSWHAVECCVRLCLLNHYLALPGQVGEETEMILSREKKKRKEGAQNQDYKKAGEEKQTQMVAGGDFGYGLPLPTVLRQLLLKSWFLRQNHCPGLVLQSFPLTEADGVVGLSWKRLYKEIRLRGSSV